MNRLIKLTFAVFDYFYNAAVFEIALIRVSYSSCCSYGSRALLGYYKHYSGERIVNICVFKWRLSK
jgi:hypothetical protein